MGRWRCEDDGWGGGDVRMRDGEVEIANEKYRKVQ